MSTLIVNPGSKEKLTIIKAFLKAMKISFVEEKPPYSSDFVVKIRQGDEDIKAGRTKKSTLMKYANRTNCQGRSRFSIIISLLQNN
jgi:hypothetical protein